MKLADFPSWLRDTLLRMFPHRAPTGLLRVGAPGRSAPVLVTGNFTLTIRRLREALKGCDVWLLCANSHGINVWCAAGGGHLTHHEIISVLRTSGISEQVDHRELILPQLCATGVERCKITEVTGWSTRWGPARLEDLPQFLKRGRHVVKAERFMRFPLWERMEMALMWAAPLLLITGLLAWAIGSSAVALCAFAVIACIVGGLFAALPWLKVKGRVRWFTFAGLAIAGFVIGLGVLIVLGSATGAHLWLAAGTALGTMGVLSIDLAGTTPWYGSYINRFHNEAHIDLVESRCTGAAECVQVCPRDVLHMDGHRRKVEIMRPEQCIECGACIVQCPEDALRFRYDDGRVVEGPTIRRTRMNMVGRRTVELSEP
ncbi:MAG: HgcAB-like fusion protein [Polyangiales bacterium]|jgi:NAD-dependent dihydropyrimidine dehydrogenase PreA subunit